MSFDRWKTQFVELFSLFFNYFTLFFSLALELLIVLMRYICLGCREYRRRRYFFDFFFLLDILIAYQWCTKFFCQLLILIFYSFHKTIICLLYIFMWISRVVDVVVVYYIALAVINKFIFCLKCHFISNSSTI